MMSFRSPALATNIAEFVGRIREYPHSGVLENIHRAHDSYAGFPVSVLSLRSILIMIPVIFTGTTVQESLLLAGRLLGSNTTDPL